MTEPQPTWAPPALSEQEYRMLGFIAVWRQEHSYGPSVRDLQRVGGYSSLSVVHYHLAALERKGMIKRDPGIARSISIVQGAM